jgi:hypothetical protein
MALLALCASAVPARAALECSTSLGTYYPYCVNVPDNASGKLPAIMFLSGSGARGDASRVKELVRPLSAVPSLRAALESRRASERTRRGDGERRRGREGPCTTGGKQDKQASKQAHGSNTPCSIACLTACASSNSPECTHAECRAGGPRTRQGSRGEERPNRDGQKPGRANRALASSTVQPGTRTLSPAGCALRLCVSAARLQPPVPPIHHPTRDARSLDAD